MDIYQVVAIAARMQLDKWELHDFEFRFDNAKKRAGSCQVGRGEKFITLSRHFVRMNEDNMEQIKDTILHEIAHAKAGPGNGHNELWKMWCRLVGANPTRCYDSKEVAMPKGKVVAYCPCHAEHRRHRMPRSYHVYHCNTCNALLTWKREA